MATDHEKAKVVLEEAAITAQQTLRDAVETAKETLSLATDAARDAVHSASGSARMSRLETLVEEFRINLKEIKIDIKESKVDSKKDLDALRVDMNKGFEKTGDRIAPLEIWMWRLLAGAAVVLYLGQLYFKIY